MYCIHCGKKLPDDTIFCIYCGKKQVSDEKSSQDIESQEKVMAPNLSTKADDDSNPSKDVEVDQTSEAHSPTFKELAHELGGIGSMIFQESGSLLNCEAKKRNDTVCPFCKENDSQPVQKNIAEVESQNYKWGKGCCGILLLGPFGLLCGLCGTGTKSKVSSELWWTCMKCGKQHLALDDALKKWDAWISALLISAITSGIIFSIFRWLEFGIISFCIELAMVIAPIGGVYGFYQEISEEIGEPLIHYLTPEQKKKCVGTVLGAVALTLVIGLFGASIWNQILGA